MRILFPPARYLLLILACCAFLFVIPQDKQKSDQQLRKEYEQAFHYYNEAVKLASSPSYNEEREEILNKKALVALKDLISPLTSSGNRSDSLLFRVHFTVGELEHYFENYSEALSHYKNALQIQPRSGLPDSVLFKPLLYSGIIYYNRGNIDSAAALFLKADTVQQHYKVTLNESQRLYNTLGVINYEAGDYRQAKNHFNRALEVISNTDPYYQELRSNYLINLAQIQFKLEEYEDALASYNKLIPLKKNLDEIYHNMALIKVELGKYNEAIALLRKVHFTGARRIKLYNSFARAYLEQGDYMKCRYYLQQAVSAYGNIENDLSAYGTSLKLLGDLASLQDSSSLAIRYYTKATNCFYPAYRDTASNHNPQKFTGTFSYINLFEVLVAKASAWHNLFRQNSKITDGDNALNTYRSAYNLLDHVLETYESDEARLFINRSRYRTLDKPIDIAYELYSKTKNNKYLEILYTIDQQNKASVLALNVIRARSMNNDPSERDVSKIKKQITMLSLQALGIKDSLESAKLNRQILDLELRLSKIRTNQPGASDLWEHLPAISSLQKDILEDGAAILSYHLSPEFLTSTVITQNKFLVTRKKLPANFRSLLTHFTQSLQVPGSTMPREISVQLYHLFFNEALAEKPKRLVIIPDNELIYLPFESLQDEQGKFAIQQFSMQYQYSTAFLKKQVLHISEGSTTSFAPFASGSAGNFENLPFSKDEIVDNKGLKFYDNKATKEQFLLKAGSSSLIHLATHAKATATPGGSFLVFKQPNGSSDLLYEEEIYNLDLQKTQLVILSACETAAGELMEGEGVMSISRAFTYAGCDNILTTLWKADDRSTTYLIRKFHHYLSRGYTIDKALLQSKLDYLEDPAINPRLKHPYYWSHLVFIGNYQPNQNKFGLLIIGVSLTVLVIGLIIVKRRFFTRS